MSAQDDKPAEQPVKPVTLGSCAMRLRHAAGWSRARFAAAANLSEADLKAFECSRNRLTVEQRQSILRHPIMRGLHDLAMAAGVKPGT